MKCLSHSIISAGYIILTLLVPGDVDLDHLVKVTFASFLPYRVAVFPFLTLLIGSPSLSTVHSRREKD